MVMKAVQQLLFDVDWRASTSASGSLDGPAAPPAPGASVEEIEAAAIAAEADLLDVLVIDMPPGTGDVALSLSQLVRVDGAIVVSTPQEVALLDARKGISLFRKTGVPIAGLVLNMSHFVSPDTGKSFPLFGPSTSFDRLAKRMNAPVLARVPLEPSISERGDRGQPVATQLAFQRDADADSATSQTAEVFAQAAAQLILDLDL